MSSCISILLTIFTLQYNIGLVTSKPYVEIKNITDPCEHIFHVHARNHEGGTWNIIMENQTGHVHHSVHGRVHDERLAGEWDAQLLQRCKESLTTEQYVHTDSTVEITETTVAATTTPYVEETKTTAKETETTAIEIETITLKVETTELYTSEMTPYVPDDYMFYPGFGSYKFHTDLKNWDDAYNECKSENAYLVVINSKEEAEVIQDLFKDHPEIEPQKSFIVNNEAFIGVRDFLQAGSFETVLGGRLRNSGFEEWEPGQPDDFEDDEDCVTILRHGTLNDRACWIELPFICEANEF